VAKGIETFPGDRRSRALWRGRGLPNHSQKGAAMTIKPVPIETITDKNSTIEEAASNICRHV